jgi:hypothetical protein
MEVMPEHVHLLLEGKTSRYLRKEFLVIDYKTTNALDELIFCINSRWRSFRKGSDILKAYCFKLYNAKRNRKLMTAINISGIIYNHCIALHKRYYKLFGKSLDTYALQKHITKLKKLKKYEFWNRVGSQSIQDITQRIDRAYKLFFRNRKQNIRSDQHHHLLKR